MFPAGLKAKMDGAEAERADLEARLAEIPDAELVAIHPGLSGIYARRVAAVSTQRDLHRLSR
ncbi:hypothetical protein EYE35_16220 [Cereibacter sphaeroides]|nr:hypothetical protein EYE35_16220 [Cereibacter sphaeroides]